MTPTIGLLLSHPTVLACATCMGDKDSPQVQAAGSAILFMLAVLALVFGGMIAVVVSVARRARRSGGGEPA